MNPKELIKEVKMINSNYCFKPEEHIQAGIIANTPVWLRHHFELQGITQAIEADDNIIYLAYKNNLISQEEFNERQKLKKQLELK